MAVQINGSEIELIKNNTGYYITVLNNKVDRESYQITVMLTDRAELESGTVIEIEEGFLTYYKQKGYMLMNRFTKKQYAYLVPQLRITKYKVVGTSNKFATAE